MMTCKEFLTVVGIALFAIGGSGMDNPDMTLPVLMTLAGLALIWITTKEDRRSGNYDGQIDLY